MIKNTVGLHALQNASDGLVITSALLEYMKPTVGAYLSSVYLSATMMSSVHSSIRKVGYIQLEYF